MRAVSVLKLAANCGSYWLCSSTQPPHCDSVIAFGGHFLLICTCSSCLLLSFLSLQFSLEPFVSISLQIEEANKLQINIFLIFGYFSLSVSPGHKVTDHILFATPETMLDWIFRHKAVDPRKIKMFVLDEADVMIAIQGHQDQSIRIHK